MADRVTSISQDVVVINADSTVRATSIEQDVVVIDADSTVHVTSISQDVVVINPSYTPLTQRAWGYIIG